ncbi:2,4'-dihydroxyacetophenone dioxygenase family protein (plasmid) [Paraburkholderia sp. PREW-6R]|uniref:2,4'-dihydroxyacetophenone dioxygenase family protein n=1 Tax=Paraburkholderia sp. PREW-6R TaxID=3141544 RepID=UPI0031F5081B
MNPTTAADQPSALLTLNFHSLPMLKEALGPGVDFQPLFIDAENGIWCIRAQFAPGVVLPAHVHTGPVHAITLSGRWYYAGHEDQPQTPGSYLYEPASGAPHQLVTPADNAGPTEIVFLVFGANINFDDGVFMNIMDAAFIERLAVSLASTQGLGAPKYILSSGAMSTER